MGKKLIRFDWAMKTLLRDKSNFDILEGFLSALLEDDKIKILNILESETNPKDEYDKFIRVDLLVVDSQNRKIYIEIQNAREKDYLESLLYATSKIIVEHQRISEDFSNVSKVISISILYFNIGVGNDYIYHGTTNFKGLNTGEYLRIRKKEEVTDALEPKYKFVDKEIFPEYYLITVERYPNIIKKKIDEWIYIFKNNEVADGSHSRNISQAAQKLAEINMSDIEKKRYEKYLITYIRDRDVFRTAMEEIEEKALEKGMEKGMEKGERKKELEFSKNLILKGFNNDMISELTGLSIDAIEEIRNNLEN